MKTHTHALSRLNKQRFGFKDLRKLGLGYHTFRKLILEGIIERVAQGVYQRADKNYSIEDNFITATVVLGKPCAVCLLSALEYYGVTDHIAKKAWMMVPLVKRTSVTSIKLFRKKNPRWDVGIENKKLYSIT
ncbi:MAG: type IV toxin-antitoxin system AbiEi family antitoxin domain-containing protein, partial [Pseudomonadota bacterium]